MSIPNNYADKPWIEKYRPDNVNDLEVDEYALTQIKKIIKTKEMPNIIITGNPGIGKTSTILCIAKKLFGEYFDQGVLELNASDDRGIKAIQENINFCKKKLDLNKVKDKNKEKNNTLQLQQQQPEKLYSDHKIILLDEADNMTSKAQKLVSNLMEQYNGTTRFAFTCNSSNDIIEAIQSRCLILRYSRLSNPQIIKRLEYICNIEKINHDKDVLNYISTYSGGDMRNAINKLQLVFNTFKQVTIKNYEKLSDKPHPELIRNIFIECDKKNVSVALKYITELKNSGFSNSDIILNMVSIIKMPTFVSISEEKKIEFLNKISLTAYIISRGIETDLQVTSCICNLCVE